MSVEDRPYDHLMLYQGMPFDLKVRRLLVVQRWVFVVSLCLSSYAPGEDRGSLVVSSGEPIDHAEIADAAGVDVEIVKATIDKMTEVGLLILIDEETGVTRFAAFDRHNPKRKPSDSREATRERKRKQREREKGEEVEQLALGHQAEVEGRAPQTVMDAQRSAPIRAVDDGQEADPLSVACPSCRVSPGVECVTRDGHPLGRFHVKRKRDAQAERDASDAPSFFRVTRDEPAAADLQGWEPIAAILRESVEDFKYGIWLAPLELVGVEGDTLYVRSPDHQRTWIRDKYHSLIADAARAVRGERAVVEIVDEQWRPAERAA